MTALRPPDREHRVAIALGVLTVVIVGAMAALPEHVPFAPIVVPLVVGAVLLGPRVLPKFVAFVALMLVVAVFTQRDFTFRTVVGVVSAFLVCLVVLVVSLRRNPLGIAGLRGESMLVDLRDRILAQGVIPSLPGSWLVESALRSAGGSPFAGDFVVATKRPGGTRLELAVVDVSGKGEAAGTRALQLSGAMGGLLGALPPEEFLPAANEYLLQRGWEEGFATAVHLSLDLTTGEYELRGAGHPPPVLRLAGSGRWRVLWTEGPVLGLLDDVEYDAVHGRLERGDVLMLYTDGMVEEPRRDIELGIDGMLGQAESLFRGSYEGLAERLAAAVGSADDDRALVLVHRR